MPTQKHSASALYLLALVDGDKGDRPFTLLKITFDPQHIAIEQVPDQIRQTVAAWSRTRQGRQARQETDGDFNWGDLSEWTHAIPWTHGILMVETLTLTETYVVSHDERLMPARVSAHKTPLPVSAKERAAMQLTRKLTRLATETYAEPLHHDDYLAAIILNAIHSGVSSATPDQTAGEIVANSLEFDATTLNDVAAVLRNGRAKAHSAKDSDE